MSSGIRNPEIPVKFNRQLVDDMGGQQESLYDIPRPTVTYCTFLGENEEIAESDSPIPGPPNEMLMSPTVRDQDTGVMAKPEVQSPQNKLSGVSSFLVQKPVIADVKIITHEPGRSGGIGKTAHFLAPPEGPPKESWSAEAIHRLEILSDLQDDDLNFRFRNRTSTFVNPANPNAKQSVYIDLGEYQTLLKHGSVKEEEAEKGSDDGERLYSLPQPQCYGEDTMKAVQAITQKFDSFKLRQLRVRSFREAAGHTRRRSSNSSVGRRTSNASTGDSVDGSGGDEQAECRRGSAQLRDKAAAEEVESAALTERDVYRIEVFYRGQEAEVYVCRCLADVFMGASTKPNDETYHWVQVHTGVPVLLLNTGTGLKPRELLVIVAQRDTALPLWQDKINYLSGYHESSPGVHMMKVSGSLSKAIQLRMIDEDAAKDFLDKFSAMTSDPDDDLWKISGAEHNQVKDGRRPQKKQASRGRRKRHLTKADISQPCNSTQLTRVDAKDRNFRAAFGDLLPALKLLVNSGDPNGNQEEDFRPRLPTR